MVEEVLTEAGIKNDPLEKLELQVALKAGKKENHLIIIPI
jgi:hypothetical protein